jgi:hypothetical protein
MSKSHASLSSLFLRRPNLLPSTEAFSIYRTSPHPLQRFRPTPTGTVAAGMVQDATPSILNEAQGKAQFEDCTPCRVIGRLALFRCNP